MRSAMDSMRATREVDEGGRSSCEHDEKNTQKGWVEVERYEGIERCAAQAPSLRLLAGVSSHATTAHRGAKDADH